MKVFPVNKEVAVLIDEESQVEFYPVVKPIKEQQLPELPSQPSRCFLLIDCIFTDFCFKLKYGCCIIITLAIMGLVIFLIACGHQLCPNSGFRSPVHSQPPAI